MKILKMLKIKLTRHHTMNKSIITKTKTKTPKLPKKIFCKSLIICFLLWGTNIGFAQTFISEQMDIIFDETMSNYTEPGAYKTARRGVISGGSLTVKTKLTDIHPVNIALPTVSAGCGGINLFSGSFSFINSEQWLQFARSVASNAVSYAFELALEEMSPSIHAIISKLQNAANLMNRYQLSSCQLAQGIVNDTLGQAFDNRAKTDASIYSATLGYFDDYFTARNGSNGNGKSDPISRIAKENPELYATKIGGNIIYNALIHANISDWYRTNNNAKNVTAELMSVIGTVIVIPQDLPDEHEEQSMIRKAPTIKFRELVEGKKGDPINLYKCSGDYSPSIPCTELSIVTNTNYQGFASELLDVLLGTDRNSGLVKKFFINQQNSEFTDKEITVMNSMPEIIAQIRNLARLGNFSIVRQHVIENAEAIGAIAAYNLVDNIYTTVRTSLEYSVNENKSETLDFITSNMNDFREEFELYEREKGGLNTSRMYQSYRDRIELLDKMPNRYTPQRQGNSGR